MVWLARRRETDGLIKWRASYLIALTDPGEARVAEWLRDRMSDWVADKLMDWLNEDGWEEELIVRREWMVNLTASSLKLDWLIWGT